MSTVSVKAGIGRREFLRVSTWRPHRTIEISCQRLHMSYLSLGFTGGVSGEEDVFTGEEPATVHSSRTVDDVLSPLEEDLRQAAVAHVVGYEWLASDQLRRAFMRLLAEFKARGGVVDLRS